MNGLFSASMEEQGGIDVSLGLQKTHVVVTGAAGQIGQVVVNAFLAAGALVSALDINTDRMTIKHENLDWYVADVRDEAGLDKVFEQARQKHGVAAACCALAGLDLSFVPHHASICDMPLVQWQTTMDVNATGTFLTAKTWLRGIRDHANQATRNISLVVTGSEAGVLGVPGNADYASSKAAIQYGLVRSLAPEVIRIAGRARVNAIAPGPVDTPQFQNECREMEDVQYQESQATVAMRQGVPMQAVAKTCLTLTSENLSSMITGQVIQVDGGKSGRIFWQADGGPTW